MARVADIQTGPRLREDMGDLAGLAESLKKYGLLHPIVVDEDLTLIAGQRRLEAAKLLGWTDIAVKYLEDLTAKEKRAVELEENLRRKDLTESEKSKNMVELAEIKAAEFRSSSEQNYPRRVEGRPSKPDNIKKVAEAVGVSVGTLVEARQHDQAMKKYPTLEPLPKKEAIQTAKEWAKDPEKAKHYTKAVEEFPELKVLPVNQAIQAAENLRQMPPEVQQEKLAQSREVHAEGQQRQKQIIEAGKLSDSISHLVSSSLKMQGMVTDEAIEAWLQFHKGHESIEHAVSCLRYGIAELTTLRDKLNEIMSGPRRVVRK